MALADEWPDCQAPLPTIAVLDKEPRTMRYNVGRRTLATGWNESEED